MNKAVKAHIVKVPETWIIICLVMKRNRPTNIQRILKVPISKANDEMYMINKEHQVNCRQEAKVKVKNPIHNPCTNNNYLKENAQSKRSL